MSNNAQRELELINEAKAKGTAATVATFVRLSGPGWLQGAITLGGGSLAGALYLGVIMGYHMMWLQPVAMILGVIMLSAISYVTLSTEERPFGAVNRHISPLLGWGWLIATIMANIVWCLPQFALGTAAIQQNLAPSLATPDGKVIAAVSLLVAGSIVVWFYESGSWGIKLFEIILKVMVGIVVLSFFGVVAAMTAKGLLPWGEIFAGLIPNPAYLFKPVPSLAEPIAAAGEYSQWWSDLIAGMQKDKIITAFATAVGINMTFLLPYSMLRKGWSRGHRELAVFDLSIGLIVPFVLATGCVVIAAASQFHGHPNDVFALEVEYEAQRLQDPDAKPKAKELGEYFGFLDQRLAQAMGKEQFANLTPAERSGARAALPEADRNLAAMLAGRDNLALAKTLAPLVGEGVAQKLFGVGVVGMALSTIIILMLINGFAFCELLGVEPSGKWHRVGTFIPAIGVLGPFVWSKAAPALATPTSVMGGAMLPIAYFSFLLLMNSPTLLGKNMPRGVARVWWNTLMIFATVVASLASVWGLLGRTLSIGDNYKLPIGNIALGALAVLLLLGTVSFFAKNGSRAE
ncbi:MAG: divalent metal cation transporter [Planctomycetales bacterium]|nr:divalent metal cation transporter [Planctomycetales bacterium]